MAQVVLAEGVRQDFDRILEHLAEHASDSGPDRLEGLIAALDLLETSPEIGRPVEHGLRELVIGRGASGFVALYRFVPALDRVFVLAVRAQREAGYESE